MDDQFAPPPPPDSPGAPPPPPPPPSDMSPAGGSAPAPPPWEAAPAAPPADPGPPPPGAPPAVPYGAPAATPVPVPKKGGGKKVLIIVIVAVLLLCCAITVAGVVIFMNAGDAIDEAITDIGGITTDATEPGAMTTSDGGQSETSGRVLVWLEWSEPVDMDLEIWDASGDEFLYSTYSLMGEDITNGSDGQETFEFRSFDTEDFSTGTYVVSAYFADLSPNEGEDFANVTLTIQDAQGSLTRYSKKVLWDPGYDQWHAVQIDAATGNQTELDEWY